MFSPSRNSIQGSEEEKFIELIQASAKETHDSLYYELFKVYRGTDLNKAKQYAKQAYDLSIFHNHKNLELKAINALAFSYSELQDLDSAKFYYKLGVSKSKTYDKPTRITYFSNDLGSLFERLDMYDSALVYYLLSLETATKNNLNYDKAIALNNIGLVFLRIENPTEALGYFEGAVKIKNEEGIKQGMDLNLLNIALCQNELGNFKSASETASKIIQLCNLEKLCNDITIQDAYYQLGYAQELLGNFKEASIQYRRVLEMQSPSSSQLSYVGSLYHLSVIYFNQDSVKALDYLKEAKERALDLKMKRILRDIYNLYSVHYERLGDLENALVYKNLFISYKDSIFNEKMANNLRLLQLDAQKKVAGETIKKQQERLTRSNQISFLTGVISVMALSIAILLWFLYKTNKNITSRLKIEVDKQTWEIKNSYRALKIINEDLNRSKNDYYNLVYRASHDLRGPVATLLGLSMLAQKEVDNGKETVIKYLEMIEMTASKQQDLLIKLVSITQVSDKKLTLDKVNFYLLLKEIVDSYKGQYTQVKYELEGEEETIIYLDKFLMSMALNFVIDNAFKYSVQGREVPSVRARFFKNAKTLTIEILNNGVGVSEDLKYNIFDLFSVGELNKGAGIGLYVAKNCIEKMNGTIELISTTTPTLFRISVPYETEVENTY